MRLEDKRLSSESFNQLMALLFGTVWDTQIPAEATPLYCRGGQWQHNDMPPFNEWGLILEERKFAEEGTGSFASSPGAMTSLGHSGEEGITEGVYARCAAVALEACSAQNSMDRLFACDASVEVEIFRELKWDCSPRYLRTSR